MIATFTDEEARFIRNTMKEAISELHDIRRTLNNLGKMAGLLNIEHEIEVADSAWSKLKEELWDTTP